MSYLEDADNQIKQRQADKAASEKAANEKMLAETRRAKVEAKPRLPVERIQNSTERPSAFQDAGSHNKLNYKDAIFRISAPKGTEERRGTGFFYSPAGEFLTDLHVVGNVNQFQIVLNSGETLTAVVDKFGRDPKHDLAACYVVGPMKKFPYLKVEKRNSEEKYQGKTLAAGYAEGTKFQESEGEFDKISYSCVTDGACLQPGEDPGREVIITKDYAAQGMSGGPLLSKNYRLMGIIDKGNPVKHVYDTITVSTPIEDAINLIERVRAQKLSTQLGLKF